MKGRNLFLLALLLLVAGCPRRTAVWVEEGSTREHLVFRVSDERGSDHPLAIWYVRVDRFVPESQTYEIMWGFSFATSPPEMTRVEYGVVPHGAKSMVPSEAGAPLLAPGCYQAYTDGTGRSVFEVEAGGVVRELDRDSCEMR